MLEKHEESVLKLYLNSHYKNLGKIESKSKPQLYKKNPDDSFGVFSINKNRKELYVNGDLVSEIKGVISYDSRKRSSVPLNTFIKKWFIDVYGEVTNDFRVVNVDEVKTKCSCKASKYNVLK